MLKTKKIIFIILFLFTGILSTALFFKYQSNKNRKKINVILIVIDALRADHLGCYGYKRDTSLNIDKFAKEGILFSSAFSHGSATRISIPSIFTSLYPGVHGVFQLAMPLADEFITLPQILEKKGYATAAFGGPTLVTFSNFNQKFQFYYITPHQERKNIIVAQHKTNKIINWLGQNYTHPFFLYIHSSVHAPYNPPPPYDKIFYQEEVDKETKLFIRTLKYEEDIKDSHVNNFNLNYLLSQYDGKIRYVDEQIKVLLEELERLGLSKDTLVILTSDHGEGFLDHERLFHGYGLYEELIHVPLIMRLPGIIPQNKVIPNLVRHVDILPTILDILNIQSNNIMQGINLLPCLREKDMPKLDAFSEINFEGRHLTGIRTDKWKFIQAHDVMANTHSYELYDLENDPREINNLVEEKPKEASLFKARLRDYTFSCRKIRRSILGKDFIDKPVILDEETKEKLRSLGYIK